MALPSSTQSSPNILTLYKFVPNGKSNCSFTANYDKMPIILKLEVPFKSADEIESLKDNLFAEGFSLDPEFSQLTEEEGIRFVLLRLSSEKSLLENLVAIRDTLSSTTGVFLVLDKSLLSPEAYQGIFPSCNEVNHTKANSVLVKRYSETQDAIAFFFPYNPEVQTDPYNLRGQIHMSGNFSYPISPPVKTGELGLAIVLAILILFMLLGMDSAGSTNAQNMVYLAGICNFMSFFCRFGPTFGKNMKGMGDIGTAWGYLAIMSVHLPDNTMMRIVFGSVSVALCSMSFPLLSSTFIIRIAES